jgi:hypothetical protein
MKKLLPSFWIIVALWLCLQTLVLPIAGAQEGKPHTWTHSEARSRNPLGCCVAGRTKCTLPMSSLSKPMTRFVRFFFPRQATVQPGDKEIIFRFEMLDTIVEAKFNLKEMLYHGQLALLQRGI